MAKHARITTALLPASRQQPTLLCRGLGLQPGPVTIAIRAMRAADPADAAIQAIRDGLDRYFNDTSTCGRRT